MNYFRFIIGFIAAIFDEMGAIRTRNIIIQNVHRDGNFLDGFDTFFDVIRR